MFPLDIPPGPVPTDGSNMLLSLIVALVLVIIAIVAGVKIMNSRAKGPGPRQ